MAQKTSVPKGTRDFGPIEMSRRNYIFDTIRDVFKLFGFNQIETPSMEHLSTLMGKYGEEGDKLLFKILNSGDYLLKANRQALADNDYVHLTPTISEKGLRYDLTVPFARYVVEHRNELSMPFKRYQIQPVWRADRPQKGRYREFYQCDADIVGSDSLINEVELIQLIDEVFRRFGINIVIKLNNRKILSGIAELIGAPEKLTDITVAIDKIDKIGIEKVNDELRSRGLSDEAIALVEPIITIDGTIQERLSKLSDILHDSEIGMKGIQELTYIIDATSRLGLRATLDLDVSLARGLNYYTGAIIEVKAADVAIGSISGGGRYDNLTGVFGVDGLSGVGISFGADRIYDVLEELNLYPDSTGATTRVMFTNFGESEAQYALSLMKQMRQAGIHAEIFPDSTKMKKQMSRANALSIPFVAIVGESEMSDNKLTLKNMTTGEQSLLTIDQAIELLNQ